VLEYQEPFFLKLPVVNSLPNSCNGRSSVCNITYCKSFQSPPHSGYYQLYQPACRHTCRMYDLGIESVYKFIQLRSSFLDANALPHAKGGSARGQATSVRGVRQRFWQMPWFDDAARRGFWLSDQEIGNFQNSRLLSL
jgi:hypothetical protein